MTIHRGLKEQNLRTIQLKEAGWANRRRARHMGRNDTAIRRCWQEWMENSRFKRHDGSGRPRVTADRKDRLFTISAVTEFDSSLSTIRRWNNADWRRIVFSDEYRFQLCPDDHQKRVWRRPGQCADPAFTIRRHTCPQPGVMV
ncbi:HTH_Tnp_Tc3_2 domain-containing protein [Trichonephila clavipes]|nr:HTH_Tnp_Tc3_2 domain-containing protein [Trichonephila clavipes]